MSGVSTTHRFGWEPDDDGSRGHVFAKGDTALSSCPSKCATATEAVICVTRTALRTSSSRKAYSTISTDRNPSLGCFPTDMGHWPFTWRLARISSRSHICCTSRDVRAPRRANGHAAPSPSISSFYASHYTRMAHRRSNRDGYLQWFALKLRSGGYAMESHCHLGNVIEYDTVTNLSWSVDVRTHAIAQLIDKVLSQPSVEPWAAAEDKYRH